MEEVYDKKKTKKTITISVVRHTASWSFKKKKKNKKSKGYYMATYKIA